jgi:hypothetical protein
MVEREKEVEFKEINLIPYGCKTIRITGFFVYNLQ